MDRLLQDFRIAARTLARQRAFSLVAILTLGLGVGATTAVFSVVYGIVVKPLPYARSDRIVALGQTAKSAPAEPVSGSSSPVNFLDWKRQSKTIPLMALYSAGRTVVSSFGSAIVVGVAANVRSQTLSTQAEPEMYVPHAQTAARTVTYVIKSSLDSANVLSAARDVVRRLDSRLPLMSPGTMNQVVDEQLARPRFYLVLLGLFAVLAVVLAAIGMYGVVAYVVGQRTREIGVRMALGASQLQVVALMLWQGLKPAIVGLAAGLAVASAAGRVIQGMLYQVTSYDPITFVGVSAVLLAVVVIACAIPARRASSVPPADALRGG